MTNHPRSPRAKFKKGQVVRVWGRLATVTEILKSYDEDGTRTGFSYYVTGSTQSHSERPLKPLTKKEAGR